VVLPLSFLFRHKPEQYGHSLNGQAEDLAAYGNDSGLLQAVESDVRAKQVFKKGIFWQLALPFTYHTLAVSTVVTHVMPYLSSVGVNRESSSFVATAIPLMSIVGRLGLGWLGDKFDKRLVAMGSFASMGFGLLCFGYASATNAWLFVPFLALFGIGYGGGNALRPSMAREYFGRASFGTILGLLIGIGGAGVLLGPTVAGWVYDNWGSYQTIWFLLAGLAIVAIVTILTIPTIQSTIRPGDEA
jgi:MFS family permease